MAKVLTEEHRKKMDEGRTKYWAKIKALKELAPKVDRLSESVYAAAKDQGEDPALTTRFIDPSISRQHILKRINTKRDKILDAKIDQATGLYYTTEDGKHVYQKKPDPGASEYLLNQLIGKPTESLEVKTVTKLMIDF